MLVYVLLLLSIYANYCMWRKLQRTKVTIKKIYERLLNLRNEYDWVGRSKI
jgi:hypothetical protein